MANTKALEFWRKDGSPAVHMTATGIFPLFRKDESPAWQFEDSIVLQLILPFEFLGEDPDALFVLFDILVAAAAPLPVFFDILKGEAGIMTPLDLFFDIMEGANALNVSFDIQQKSIQDLRKGTDPNTHPDVQRPVIEVGIG